MITFINKEFITDNHPQEGVLVIDTDLQGTWEFQEHARFRWAFPNTYRLYQKTCMYDYNRAGTCLLTEEGGYKLALLFSRVHRKDSKEDMLVNISKAIDELFRKVPCDVFIYSPVLARKDKCFDVIRQGIKQKLTVNGVASRNWFIYRKQCPLLSKENK